jgi:hypothetical protein
LEELPLIGYKVDFQGIWPEKMVMAAVECGNMDI